MKKGFTLIEIIITLMLIGLALTMVTSMGRGFSDRIRFANTKEEVTAKITNVIQEAATTNSVTVGTGQQRYGRLTLSIPLSGTSIEWVYSSGEILDTDVVSGYSLISHGSIVASGYTLVLQPYTVGCTIEAGSSFTIVSADNPSIIACYETSASTCKIREVKCN